MFRSSVIWTQLFSIYLHHLSICKILCTDRWHNRAKRSGVSVYNIMYYGIQHFTGSPTKHKLQYHNYINLPLRAQFNPSGFRSGFYVFYNYKWFYATRRYAAMSEFCHCYLFWLGVRKQIRTMPVFTANINSAACSMPNDQVDEWTVD